MCNWAEIVLVLNNTLSVIRDNDIEVISHVIVAKTTQTI